MLFKVAPISNDIHVLRPNFLCVVWSAIKRFNSQVHRCLEWPDSVIIQIIILHIEEHSVLPSHCNLYHRHLNLLKRNQKGYDQTSCNFFFTDGTHS